jgi:ATP-dependent DNA ligase
VRLAEQDEVVERFATCVWRIADLCRKSAIRHTQELVIGGYVPAPKNFDSIIVGYYERNDLIYVARVRAGFVLALRAKVFERFHKLEIKTCPFSNLPQRDKGRWGQGLTADKMAECRWLKPHLTKSPRSSMRIRPT